MKNLIITFSIIVCSLLNAQSLFAQNASLLAKTGNTTKISSSHVETPTNTEEVNNTPGNENRTLYNSIMFRKDAHTLNKNKHVLKSFDLNGGKNKLDLSIDNLQGREYHLTLSLSF